MASAYLKYVRPYYKKQVVNVDWSDPDHVEALSAALAAFGTAARKGIDQANELGDLDTADLFTEVSRGIDKWLWFVEAHLQAER
jgi:DNA-binding ferritin-like protein